MCPNKMRKYTKSKGDSESRERDPEESRGQPEENGYAPGQE